MSRGLSLEVSLNKERFDHLGTTYRDEGLSIGADHMVSDFLMRFPSTT